MNVTSTADVLTIDLGDGSKIDQLTIAIPAIMIQKKPFRIGTSYFQNEPRHLAGILQARTMYLRAVLDFGLIGLLQCQDKLGITPAQPPDEVCSEIGLICLGVIAQFNTLTFEVELHLDIKNYKNLCDRSMARFLDFCRGSPSPPLPETKTDWTNTSIIIARYQEDLKWCVPEAKYITLYDKNSSAEHALTTEMKSQFHRYHTLPNIGREAHTYLTHIINNYDHLPQYLIFLQGRIDDHGRNVDLNLGHYVDDLRHPNSRGFSSTRCHGYNHWGRISHIGKWLDEITTGRMRPAHMTFGDFWRDLFGTDHPEHIIITFGACFGVRRANILARPKSFYEKAILYLDHLNPEEGHYFERLWYAIFHTEKSFSM